MKKFQLTTPARRIRQSGKSGNVPLIRKNGAGQAVAIHSRLTKLQAIQLIGGQDRRAGDDLRSSENRSRLLLSRAIVRGEVQLGSDQKIALGDLITWAQEKRTLRKVFAGLNGTKIAAALDGSAVAKASLSASLSPATLEECRRDLGAANVLIRGLRVQLAALESEVAKLRPLEMRAKERSAKASKAAKAPRRLR